MDSPALNTQVMIGAVVERASSTDPLVLLEAAGAYAGLTGTAAEAMVDRSVQIAREVGLSWTEDRRSRDLRRAGHHR
ncbi:hypothetical protein [Nonomuraea sp. JJY05]|uniref:hypothetical protein n=1 Tax=Nonomuraea sp. JJY05 TaxID=3350255 RepID=UPI00373EBB05